MAELDPLWAILSDPDKKYRKWDIDEFFRIGDREAHRVLEMCRSNGIGISSGNLLDFGCGAGRMTRAYSKFFEKCVGIDISDKMIGLAKEFNSDRVHCQFIASDSQALPFPDNSFDYVFSVLVLQHLGTKRMILGYISEFIRVAKSQGVIIFQLPNEVPFRNRVQGRRRFWSVLSRLGIPESYLYGKLGLSPIRMNGIPRDEVERFVREKGARVRAVERYDPTEGRYHSYYYFVTKGNLASGFSNG